MSEHCWTTETAAHFDWMRAGSASAGTIRCRRYYLDRLAAVHADACPWDLSTDDLAAFVGRPEWAPETRKSARASVRRFYGWARLTGRIVDDPASRLPTVRVPPGVPDPAPDDVVQRALTLASDPKHRAWVLLERLAGYRRAEVAVARHRDLTRGPVPELVVHGKGGRSRVVPVHPALLAALDDLPIPPRGGYWFPGRDDGHVSPEWVGKVLSRLLGDGWTGHKLRHAAASSWYAVERDLRATQELLGHAKPETTMRYTRVPDGAKLAAVLGATG